MKTLFAHDHVFLTHPGAPETVYSRGRLPYAAFLRYLRHFDSVSVVGRHALIPEAEAARCDVASGAGLSFTFVPNISSPQGLLKHYRMAHKMMGARVAEVDFIIARVPSEVGAMAVRCARELGKPYALEVVACAWDGLWNYGNLAGKVWAPIAFLRARNLIRRAPAAIYVTEKFLQGRYPTLGFSASASNVEISAVPTEVLDRRLAHILSRSSGSERVIGLIGGLNMAAKGFDVALRALKELPPYFRLEIVGEGTKDRWEGMAHSLGVANRVIFQGSLPSGEPVYRWLDGLDAYIQPSYQEGLPRALIEAMSRGLPCWGSSAGGIPELLEREFIHRAGEATTLARQMGAVLGDPVICRSQAECNFRAAARYSKDKLDIVRNEFWQRAVAVCKDAAVGAGTRNKSPD